VWNCKDDPSPADIPAVPADVTTIVINWKWVCPDTTPPPLDVASVVECVDCNINISVRVASPGDNGPVTQTTKVDVPATATAVAAVVDNTTAAAPTAAEATQAAAQTVVPPQPPVVSPPAPPRAPTLQTAAATPAPAVPAVPAPPTPPDPPVIAPVGPTPTPDSAEPAPRHGAPEFDAAPPPAQHAAAHVATAPPAPVTATTVVRAITIVHVRTVVRTHERPVHPAGRAPLRFPPRPATPPEPAILASAAGEAHGTGGFTPLALSLGGVGALLLMFLAYAAPGLQTVRQRAGQARPHPPG